MRSMRAIAHWRAIRTRGCLALWELAGRGHVRSRRDFGTRPCCALRSKVHIQAAEDSIWFLAAWLGTTEHVRSSGRRITRPQHSWIIRNRSTWLWQEQLAYPAEPHTRSEHFFFPTSLVSISLTYGAHAFARAALSKEYIAPVFPGCTLEEAAALPGLAPRICSCGASIGAGSTWRRCALIHRQTLCSLWNCSRRLPDKPYLVEWVDGGMLGC